MAFSANTYKGITIKFEGDTKQLGSALKDIDQQARTVNSELTEINKGLKLDPKNTDLLAQKFNKIGEAINTTKERLKTLKSVQSEVEQQFKDGKIGEDAFKSFNAEISKAENALKRFQKEAKASADKIKSELSSAVDKLASDVKKTSVAVAGIITALGGITMSAASTADELTALSKVTGLSTEELQRFNYASKLVDVSTETLQTSLKRLVRSMQSAASGQGDAFESFEALGVNITDAAGQLRSNEDVFYDVIDALGQIENVTQRDAYAMNIFGKSAQDLNPLIIAGSQALKDYGDQADRMGLIFDQKTLDNLNEAQDKIDIAKQQLEGVKMIVGSELVSSFDSLFGGVDNLLKAVQKAKEDGTLAEIADTVAKSLKALIEILISAAKFVYEYRSAIAAGVAAMIAFKAAMNISNIVIILVNAYKTLKGAQDAATASQIAFNSAAMANPYALLIAGIVALTAALATLIITSEDSVEQFYEEIDAVKQAAEESNEAVRSYNELKDSIGGAADARKKSISDIEAEHSGYRDMIDRLYELDSQTELTNEAQSEMKSLVEQLEQAIPGLNVQIDAQTGHITSSKEALLEWVDASEKYKEAQAAMQAQSEAYTEKARLEAEKKKLENKDNEIDEEVQKLRKERAELEKEEAELNKKAHDGLFTWTTEKYNKFRDAYGEIDSQLDVLYISATETSEALDDVNNSLSEVDDEIKVYSEIIEEGSEDQNEFAKAAEKASESASDLTENIEKNAKAYENAKSRLSTYKSELSSLLGMLKEVNSGTAYSTSQILDLIEKYPQLANAVKLTSDGYTIEAQSIEALVKQKADLMLLEAQEAEKAALNSVYNYTSAFMSDPFNVLIQKQLRDATKQWKTAVEYYNNIEKIRNDIVSGKITYGTSGTSSSSSSSSAADTTDYWKQAAEQEISEAEHLYKMGEISAEEYYRRLADINRRYYENKAEYLEEYNKLAETVYAGLKKLEEDQLSSTQNLIDRINELKKARESLENTERQKVSVYSSAAGFHAEANTQAIDAAAQSLQSAQFNLAKLLQTKFDMKIELPDISGLDLKSILPDLSAIKIPTASAAGTKQTTVNYQAGNIYISGSADSETVTKLRKLMQEETREFFDAYLAEYIDQADRDRQTGGD
jgi:chromosome segregation ATPase